MFAISKPSQEQELKRLFQTVFHDTDEYINLFFAKKYRPENTFIFLQHDTIASMCYILPVQLVYQNNHYKAAYLYAVGTREDYRSRGLAKQMLQNTAEVLRQRGYDYIITVPANEGLFRFYEKLGYQTKFFVTDISFAKESLPKQQLELIPIAPWELFLLRKQRFANATAFVQWDEEALDFVLHATSIAVKYYLNENWEYAVYRIYEGNCFVEETSTKAKDCQILCAALDAVLDCCSYTVRLQVQDNNYSMRPFAMVKRLGKTPLIDSNNNYFSLVLD